MTSRRPRVRALRYETSPRRRAGLALLALLLGLLPMLGKVAHAQTTAEVLPLSLTVNRISPTAPQPGDQLSVGGVLTNPTGLEYDNLTVALRISLSPLLSRSALLAVASSTEHFDSDDAGQPTQVASLLPGASTPFLLQVPVDALNLTSTGVYRLSVEVSTGDVDNKVYEARVNTFLPWLPPSAAVAPINVSWLWPMLSTPRLLPDNSFSDDGLGVEIAPRGRLGLLLDVARQAAGQGGTVPAETAPLAAGTTSTDPAPTAVKIRPVPVTPLVDPENWQELTLMSDPATPYVVGPTKTPGVSRDAATSFLAGLKDLLGKTTTIATPYADPDIEALTAARAAFLVTQARNTGLEAGIPGVLPGLLWPPDGTLSESALDQLTTSGLVLSGRAVPVTNAAELGYTPTGTVTVDRAGGTVPAVVIDDSLSRLATTPTKNKALLAQRFAAETAAIAVETGPTAPRTLVLAPARRWSPKQSPVRSILDETGRLPWLNPIGVQQALQSPTDPAVVRAALHEPPNQPTLPDGTAGRIAQTSAELAAYESILCPASLTGKATPTTAATTAAGTASPGTSASPGSSVVACHPDDLVLPLRRSLYRAASTAFRDPTLGGTALLNATISALAATEQQVRITTKGNDVLVGSRAKVAISIVNDLPVPVRVQLVLRSKNPALHLGGPVAVTIAAHGNVQQNVTVRTGSVGGGKVLVDAQLLTPAGRGFGAPAHLQVQVSAAGAVIVTITVAVCTLLGLAVVVRLYRRIRNARRGSPDAPVAAAQESQA